MAEEQGQGSRRKPWDPGPNGELDESGWLSLSDDDLKRLDDILPPGAAAGERYPDMSWVRVESP